MRNSYLQQLQILLAAIFVVASCDSATAQPGREVEQSLKMSARFHVESGTNKGFLIVKIDIPAGSYIYSLTQKPPLKPTKLSVRKNKSLVVNKSFQTDKKPKVIEQDPVFRTRVEKHFGTVQFFVPIKVDTSTDLKSLKPEIQFSGQVCSDQGFCKLINNKKVQAQFAGFFQREAKSTLPTINEK